MSNRALHIDDLLNAASAAFEPAVPAFAWDRIAADLDKKERKGGFVWWKAAAIVAVIGGLGTAAWFASVNKTDAQQQAAKVEQKQTTGIADSKPASDKETTDNVTASAEKTRILPGVTGNTVQNQPNASKPESHNVIKDEITQHEELTGNAGTAAKSFDLLNFGIRADEVGFTMRDAAGNLMNFITPPDHVMGARLLIGLGVGQAVSTTGFTVDPQYGNYVHKNFTRRMSEGEGILSALSFSGQLAYRIAGHHFIFTGANYYQRRNALNFDFHDDVPALNSVGNVEKDKFGNYPIKAYLTSGSGIDVKFSGTNTISSIDIPLGWMGQFPVAKGLTLIPSASVNLGLISLNSNNSTLNYQLLEVEKVNSDWYRKTYTLLNTSAGLYKDLGMRIKWGVNVNAGYTLTQMYVPGAPVRPRAFNGGITTQLLWRLD